jgi:hypothetical protein
VPTDDLGRGTFATRQFVRVWDARSVTDVTGVALPTHRLGAPDRATLLPALRIFRQSLAHVERITTMRANLLASGPPQSLEACARTHAEHDHAWRSPPFRSTARMASKSPAMWATGAHEFADHRQRGADDDVWRVAVPDDTPPERTAGPRRESC